jgi:hypothetical protein
MKFYCLIVGLCLYSISFSQLGRISGRVYHETNNEALPFSTIIVVELGVGAVADLDGKYVIDGIESGLYTVKASSVGYEEMIVSDVSVTQSRLVNLDFPLKENAKISSEVVIEASPFRVNEESPVSLRTLNATEIERYPGANRDVSRVIQALPGVAQVPSFRNDIIIRGGAPGENKFYLDDIEVPNINHFATQGSSGGPVGLLNINFIREVEFYSGAFPANRANGLSSVLSFKQKRGNTEALITSFTVGSSDFGLTFDGPIGEKANFIFSVRTSYLQLLFKALKLPFLPQYNDAQYKVDVDLNKKNRLTFIGLGAIDNFQLNESVNDGITDEETLKRNQYILGNLPVNQQWNYTVGAKWTHFSKNSYQTIVVSRNMLNNSATRYFNNIQTIENKLLDYNSFEAENKFRFEHDWKKNGWKWNVGFGYELANYSNKTYNIITVNNQPFVIDFQSDLIVSKGSVFSQLSKSFFANKLNTSFGLRTDFANYSESMKNPMNQLSPLFSASYMLTDKWTLSSSIGRYHQLPAYTILGFRNAQNELVNKMNNASYIRVDHYVGGLAYLTPWKGRVSVEGFYKMYDRYPFSVRDSISLANLGSDFGVLGNEEITSTSKGRAVGGEFLYQQKLVKGFYGIIAYTFVRSEFLDKNEVYVPSSWDSRHILSMSVGKQFKKGWEMGVRWRYSGGAPFTPYDNLLSAQIPVWNTNGMGVLNFDQLNAMRLGVFHQMDIRVDKKFFFPRWSMNFYLDIQNLYNFRAELPPILNVVRDSEGNPQVNPENQSSYLVEEISNVSGTIIPTFGIIIEFTAKRKAKLPLNDMP